VAIVLVGASLFAAQRFLERRSRAVPGARFGNQAILLVLSFVGLLIVIMALPIADETQGQLLGLIGIIVSAAIALSATTLMGNALAGGMMRMIRNFGIGDFIRCGDHFGRVSERGLFHTEIQNEDRELTTLPNLFLVTNPVTTLRKSGTMVYTHVSLGYDVPRTVVEPLLLEAARAEKLDDPFVYVTHLGDFSITYRVAGLLTEVKQYISRRARLRSRVLDALHEGGVEIVSPNFMNQRVLPEGRVFVPNGQPLVRDPEGPLPPEEVIFDKAEKAASLEELKRSREDLTKEIERLKAESKKASEEDKPGLDARIASEERKLETLTASIEQADGAKEDD
jgi:small-conductance mechanosensitive channel